MHWQRLQEHIANWNHCDVRYPVVDISRALFHHKSEQRIAAALETAGGCAVDRGTAMASGS